LRFTEVGARSSGSQHSVDLQQIKPAATDIAAMNKQLLHLATFQSADAVSA
jgi:hypothetical protein